MKHKLQSTNSASYKCLEDLQKDSVDLSLVTCGEEDCNPRHRYGPNRRKIYLIHVIRSGKGVLEIKDKVYHLNKGDVFLIPLGETAWYEADKEDPWSYTWIGFIGIKSEECIAEAGFRNRNYVVSTTCMEKLKDLITEMMAADSFRFEDELKRSSLLYEFFSVLIKDYKKNHPESIEEPNRPNYIYVKQAMEYIFCNYNQRIKIGDLAEYIGVNRSYLTASFKENLGCSPKEYLLDFRMKKAQSLLKKTALPIGAIANAVGYNDSLAFSKIFKQHFGLSPSVYREQKNKFVKLEKNDDII